MKRPPIPGEMILRHATENTGDIQEFGICAANYDPAVIARMKEMLHEPIMGYRLKVFESLGALMFLVEREDGTILSENRCMKTGRTLVLTTEIVRAMSPDEAIMLADLEQCAALALMGIEAS